jgi:hypothetical protein
MQQLGAFFFVGTEMQQVALLCVEKIDEEALNLELRDALILLFGARSFARPEAWREVGPGSELSRCFGDQIRNDVAASESSEQTYYVFRQLPYPIGFCSFTRSPLPGPTTHDPPH